MLACRIANTEPQDSNASIEFDIFKDKIEAGFNRRLDMTKRPAALPGKMLEDAITYLRLTAGKSRQISEAIRNLPGARHPDCNFGRQIKPSSCKSSDNAQSIPTR